MIINFYNRSQKHELLYYMRKLQLSIRSTHDGSEGYFFLNLEANSCVISDPPVNGVFNMPYNYGDFLFEVGCAFKDKIMRGIKHRQLIVTYPSTKTQRLVLQVFDNNGYNTVYNIMADTFIKHFKFHTMQSIRPLTRVEEQYYTSLIYQA